MTATAIYIAEDLDVDYDGDEVLVHNVYAGDDEAEPTGRVYTVRRGADAAFALGRKMAADRRLELVTA